MATVELDRGRVLAHRAVVQDLAGPADRVAASPLLGLGVQDTPSGSGLVALAARTSASEPLAGLFAEGGPLAVVMAARGAPHVVARSQLPLLTAALFPLDEREGTEVEAVAQAMRAVADGRAVSRPALSEALNDKVADSLRSWCDRCGSRHVREGLFRTATLQAGLELDPAKSSPTVFRPSGARPAAAGPDRLQARAELARRYVHVTGVATPADLAAWLGCKPGQVRATWTLIAQELTACTVAGTRRWALTADLESLRSAPRPAGANLLAPSDPYLLGDRALVVPDRVHQRQLWRPVANPGPILLNDEITGTWRHRRSGHQLHVTLTPFSGNRFTPAVMQDLTRAAERVAALRDCHEAAITVAAAQK